MDVRSCKRCRKLFQYAGNPTCPACIKIEDELFIDVRNFIESNPRATMEAICEACGVEAETVRRWLKEGRLIMQSGGASLLQCERCAKPIATGRYCEDCRVSMVSTMSGAAKSLKPQEAPKPTKTTEKNRMYTADRKKP